MIKYTATYTDYYELTMAYTYFMKGMGEEEAVFDYYYRTNPFGSGYSIFAGLETLLDALESLRFDQKDMEFLSACGFDQSFLKYLEGFEFKGNVFSAREGDLIFPNRPILQVEGNIIEAQLVESLLLNILNFQSLIATKASRVRRAAGSAKLVDFGMRRAQGPGAYYAARASYIGGLDGTSNVKAALDFEIPAIGTMAHSFVQSFDSELEAFRTYAKYRPNDVVLLVDTYDTVGSGVPNSIIVGKELAALGKALKGIRLDSGDLAKLSKKARKMLDAQGLDYVKIVASNELDENVIESLLQQEASIDFYGVGTKLVTGKPDAAFDGVYKLAHFAGKPRVKLSETPKKISLPHKKQVYRALDSGGAFSGHDLISLRGEKLPRELRDYEPILGYVMVGGRRTVAKKSILEIRDYSRARFESLPDSYGKNHDPGEYKVWLTQSLESEKAKLILEHRGHGDAGIDHSRRSI